MGSQILTDGPSARGKLDIRRGIKMMMKMLSPGAIFLDPVSRMATGRIIILHFAVHLLRRKLEILEFIEE